MIRPAVPLVETRARQRRKLRSASGDQQLRVPVGSATQATPRVEDSIEPLASIAKCTNKQHNRCAWIVPESCFCRRLIVSITETHRVDPVVDASGTSGIDSNALDHIAEGAVTIAEDQSRLCQRDALGRDVLPVSGGNQRRVDDTRCCRLVRGVNVMCPRHVAGVDVPSVRQHMATERNTSRERRAATLVRSGSPRL